MKKILIIVFCLGTMLMQCVQAQTIRKANDLMTCLPGWDIYKAGTYRYGPCFILNDEHRGV